MNVLLALAFAASTLTSSTPFVGSVTLNEPAPYVYGQSVSFTAQVPKQFYNRNRKPQYPITGAFQVDCYDTSNGIRLVMEDFAATQDRDPISGGWLVHTVPLPMSGPLWLTPSPAQCVVTVWYIDNGPNNQPTFVIVASEHWTVGV